MEGLWKMLFLCNTYFRRGSTTRAAADGPDHFDLSRKLGTSGEENTSIKLLKDNLKGMNLNEIKH